MPVIFRSQDALGRDGYKHYEVQARLALLMKDFKRAEIFYLEQGKVEECVAMYQSLQKWEAAIQLAESKVPFCAMSGLQFAQRPLWASWGDRVLQPKPDSASCWCLLGP